MKKRSKTLLVGFSLMALLFLDLAPEAVSPIRWVPEAAAIIGLPFTPFSVAGVARRTTRRAIRRDMVVAATASLDGSDAHTAAPPPAPATPPPTVPAPTHPVGAPPPIGAIVKALPSGCVASPHGDIEYYNCGGVFYRAAFQGSNLVYVVQNP